MTNHHAIQVITIVMISLRGRRKKFVYEMYISNQPIS